MKRKFELVADKFLLDYGVAFKEADRTKELDNGGLDRVRAFRKIHKEGLKRIRAIVAEFGK